MPGKVFVAGPGALGLFLARSLSRAGAGVTLLARAGTPPATLSPVIHAAGSSDPSLVEGAALPLLGLDAVPAEDWRHARVVVAVKARDLGSVLARMGEIAERAKGSPAALLVLSNGLGITKTLREWKASLAGSTPFAHLPTARGTAWFGCLRESRERIRFAGPARLDWAWLDADRDENLGTALSRSLSPWGIPVFQEKSAERLEWRKGAWNSSMNPLLALANLPNGAVLEVGAIGDQFHALLEEAFAVARAEGFPLEEQDLAMIREGIRHSGSNWNSMHGDLRGGRPTELPFLNAWLVARARERGIAVPAHERLLSAVLSFKADLSHG